MDKGFLYIVASRNEERVLSLAMDMLERHSAYDHKVVVCLNDSTDGSAAMLREKGIDVIETHRPCRFESMNLAAQYAVAKYSNRYLFFSHNDILPLPKWDVYLMKYASPDTGLIPNVLNVNPKYPLTSKYPGCYDTEDPVERFVSGGYEEELIGAQRLLSDECFPVAPGDRFYRVFPPLLVDRVKFFEAGQWPTDLAHQVMFRLEDMVDRLAAVGVSLVGVNASFLYHFSWQASRNYLADNIDYRDLKGLSNPESTTEELRQNLEELERWGLGSHPYVGNNPDEYASIKGVRKQ